MTGRSTRHDCSLLIDDSAASTVHIYTESPPARPAVFIVCHYHSSRLNVTFLRVLLTRANDLIMLGSRAVCSIRNKFSLIIILTTTQPYFWYSSPYSCREWWATLMVCGWDDGNFQESRDRVLRGFWLEFIVSPFQFYILDSYFDRFINRAGIVIYIHGE